MHTSPNSRKIRVFGTVLEIGREVQTEEHNCTSGYCLPGNFVGKRIEPVNEIAEREVALCGGEQTEASPSRGIPDRPHCLSIGDMGVQFVDFVFDPRTG